MVDYHFPSLPVYTPDPSGGTIDTLRQNLSGGQAYPTPTSTTPLPLISEDGGTLTSIRTDTSGMSTPFITNVPGVYVRFGTGPAVYMYTDSLTPAQVEEARVAAVQAAASAANAVGQASSAAQSASSAAFAAEASRLAAVAAAGGTGTTPIGGGTGGTPGPHKHNVADIQDMSAIGSTMAKAATGAMARDAIGAGVSNVTVKGVSTGAAAPANEVVYMSSAQTISGRKTFELAPFVPDDSFPVSAIVGLEQRLASAGTGTPGTPSTGSMTLEQMPAGTTITINKVAGVWPGGATPRPTARADITIFWAGPNPGPPIVTSGRGGMLDNVDKRLVTP